MIVYLIACMLSGDRCEVRESTTDLKTCQIAVIYEENASLMTPHGLHAPPTVNGQAARLYCVEVPAPPRPKRNP